MPTATSTVKKVSNSKTKGSISDRSQMSDRTGKKSTKKKSRKSAPSPRSISEALESVSETPAVAEAVGDMSVEAASLLSEVLAGTPRGEVPAPVAPAAIANAPSSESPVDASFEAQRCVATAMTLNRCLVPANQRVKQFNFDLDALVGFDMQNVVIGVVGEGETAVECTKLMGAFDGKVISKKADAADISELYSTADIVAFHMPAGSAPVVTSATLAAMKPTAMVLAASAACDMEAAVSALEAKTIGYLGCLDMPTLAPELAARVAQLPTALVPGVTPVASATAATAASTEPVIAGSAGEGAARIAFFSSRSYFTERFAASAEAWNAEEGCPTPVRFEMHSSALSVETAGLAKGCRAVCLFVNDECDAPVLSALKEAGVELVLMRCAGFDKVDLATAGTLGIKVARVPAYSPEAVAQQAVALLMTLKWQLASTLPPSGPLGLDLSGTTVGVLGTGRIGYLFAMVVQKFGCNVVAYDPFKNKAIIEAGIPYLELDEVYAQADVLSLHVPLLPTTKYMINEEAIGKMKPGVTLLNVSRGALIDTAAVISGLESGKIGAYGSDVYEGEAAYFFDDHSKDAEIADKLLSQLISMPTVQLTGHQAFLTNDALSQIVGTTVQTNLKQHLEGGELQNEVKAS